MLPMPWDITPDQMGQIIPVIVAIVAATPGIIAILAQRKKDLQEKKNEEIKVKAQAKVDEANADKILGDTYRSVVADLRSELKARDEEYDKRQNELQRQFTEERDRLIKELNERDTKHAEALVIRDKKYAEERNVLQAQLEHLSERLEDALRGIEQLHAQVKELGGTPVYPTKKGDPFKNPL